MKSVVQFRLSAFILLATLLLAGCAHYQLGTGGKLAFTTLYVEPVGTKVLLPQAQALVSSQLRSAFNRDGRVTLVNSPEAADATLKVVLSDFRREVAAQRTGTTGDSGLARKFTITLGATATLTDNRAHRALFTDRPVNAHRDTFTDGGQIQSEYQSLPLLADALADKLTHAVLDVW